ncbi:MAG TPA: FAD-dependent oxidoreductase [Streptosporangiaceae bacterium]|nr:FAD-dependent oxidoreductase [Streptosporangiaceae bacterium]
MTSPARVVVAGAGLAGLRMAEELRARGYDGALTLIGAEKRPPYDRPPLSKKLMTGELDDTGLRADLASLAVDLRLGESAAGVQDHVLSTDAAEYEWDALIIATGASPVRLPGSGPQHVLRTADDALAIRSMLKPRTSLAIVGAGWIGAELATAAASRGCRVTVLEAADTPLAAAIGTEVGGSTAPWYAEMGVDLRLGESVAAIEPGGVALGDGRWLPADVVVTAVGVRPAVSWLTGTGIRLDNGVAVDAQLRTGVPGVYAVGDCASFWSGRYQRQLRFEHWDIALHAPEVAAANVLGGSTEYDPVPYFWSEQFGRMVQYVGWHGGADRLLWRGDPAAAKWAAAWLAGDRLVAALTVGLPRDLMQARRLIEAGSRVDAAKLANPGVAVRDSAVSG